MIGALVATLVLQAAPDPAPDAATTTIEVAGRCMDVMTGRAEPPAGPERVTLDDGREARIEISAAGCRLSVDDWSPDGGVYATRVRDGLAAASGHWTVSQWRASVVNESGPTRWTTLVFPDIRRHSAFWIQIIEPERGAPERLSITFGIAP